MMKKFQMIIASTLLAAGMVSIPASAATLSLNGVKCGATLLTDQQPGFTACLGAFTGNMDNQLGAIFSTMAKSTANNGLGFSTSTYFSSENYSVKGNPFSQNEGSRDDGVINFDMALTGSFVLGLKQGNGFALYQFDASKVVGGISSILYDTNGVKTNGGMGLSHAGFFGTPVMLTPVPEADTYAMMLAGLGVLGFVARRRKAKAA